MAREFKVIAKDGPRELEEAAKYFIGEITRCGDMERNERFHFFVDESSWICIVEYDII
jgi:hypothetical protein